ncbi:hypothetical protein IFM89_030654 [Coptis chinensis]|uniref:Uncharacterized protein n=1 Tax=Coptis chinensis TaxID=261450 RepID=A0A835IVP1_9MAGN|nr:hypothetical protein IFM89_030654 [Coptis chinensis]
MDADRMVMTGNHSAHDDGMGFWKFMLAGSVAGMVEHMAMFPVDTLKNRMQMLGTTSTASSSAHRHNTGRNKPGHHPLTHTASGVLATTASDVVLTPLDVVKQRLQLKKSPYSGVKDCVTRMLEE